MTALLTALPWWLASLSSLIVGGVCFVSGVTDVWVVLERMGIAFAAFLILGLIARILLSTGQSTHNAADISAGSTASPHGRKGAGRAEGAAGEHEDAHTNE